MPCSGMITHYMAMCLSLVLFKAFSFSTEISIVFSVMNDQVGAPARVGLVAPIDVVVPPGNTGLDPSQTSFFQVYYLNYMMMLIVLAICCYCFNQV